MNPISATARPLIAACAIFTMSACAGTYTGPVEVTRFVAEDPTPLGQGTITLVFPDEMSNGAARNAFASAVADELSNIGYTLVMNEGEARSTAAIRTSRDAVATIENDRGPVSVGVGGSTGTFGSGVGVGVGVNLGGGRDEPEVVTKLSVRIRDSAGETVWEGRAQHPVSLKSDYADVETSAAILAAALFRDFPGGNGETLTLDVDDIQK